MSHPPPAFRLFGRRKVMRNRVLVVGRRILVCLFAVCLCSSRVAAAQGAPASPAPTSVVRPGQTVWVTTADGREVHGTVETVSTTGISVQSGKNVTPVRWTETRRIDVPDSIVDGVVTGAVVGGLAGLVPPAIFFGMYGECPCSKTSGTFLQYSMLGAGIGAAIGAAADSARIGRKQIYRASPTVSLAPVLLPGRISVSGAIRW